MADEVSRPGHRYVVLDSLRGVAACIVVLFHTFVDVSGRPVPFIEHGWLFVDFFFVLSGFVVGSGYGRRLAEGYPIGWYMTQRFFRIYPLHVVVLLVFLAFEIGFALLAPGAANRQPFEGVYSLSAFVASLFLVQIFLGPNILSWNGPSWSIAGEFWTYLLFALLMKLRPRAIVPVCIAVALFSPFYLANVTDRSIAVFHHGALVRCLYDFSLGVLCWQLPDRLRACPLPRWADQLLELGAVALCVTFITFVGVEHLSLAAPFVFVVAVTVFSREGGSVSSLLRLQPFAMLGRLSYAIYMLHWFLLWRFINVLSVAERMTGLDLVVTRGTQTGLSGGFLLQGFSTLVFLAGLMVAAQLAYWFIERPGIRLGKALIARRQQHLPAALPVNAAGL